MRKILLALTFLIILMSIPVYAHCPVCTVAVGAAAVSAKYYGLDTSIIGLLIGAFGISTGLWFGLKIKKQFFRYQLPVIVILSFVFTVVPLLALNTEYVYFPLLLFGAAGTALNKVYWLNKLLLGSIIGGFITLAAFRLHLFIKSARGKGLFPFQGVVLTALFLAVTGIGMYFAFGA